MATVTDSLHPEGPLVLCSMLAPCENDRLLAELVSDPASVNENFEKYSYR